VEWVTGNMNCGKVYGTCVCAALSMPEYGNKKWRDVVVLEGGATNWVYKFAAETCPTIKQTYCQGPASVVPFQ